MSQGDRCRGGWGWHPTRTSILCCHTPYISTKFTNDMGSNKVVAKVKSCACQNTISSHVHSLA